MPFLFSLLPVLRQSLNGLQKRRPTSHYISDVQTKGEKIKSSGKKVKRVENEGR